MYELLVLPLLAVVRRCAAGGWPVRRSHLAPVVSVSAVSSGSVSAGVSLRARRLKTTDIASNTSGKLSEHVSLDFKL